jgi:hypothetical protein
MCQRSFNRIREQLHNYQNDTILATKEGTAYIMVATTEYRRKRKGPEDVKQLLQLRVTGKESLPSGHFSCIKIYEHHSGVKVFNISTKLFEYTPSLNQENQGQYINPKHNMLFGWS